MTFPSHQKSAHLEGWAEAIAAAALVSAPLALGMAHLSTTLAVSALGWLSLLVLAIARRGRLPRPGLVAGALLAVSAAIGLQLVPLPPGLLSALSPEHERIAKITLGGLDEWRPLTLDVPATCAELAKWLGWTGVAWVLRFRAASSRGARGRVRLYVAGAAAVVAGIGLLHFAAGEKRSLFGLYEFQARNAFRSTFGNSNHLAGFLNLGGLLALGMSAAAERLRGRIGWALVFVACAAGTFLSASRAGFVALLAGLLVLGAIRVASRRVREGWAGWLTVGGTSAAAGGVAAWIYLQFPSLLREIATLLDLDPANEEGKLEALLSGWRAAQGSWLTGVGKGAFGTVGRVYQEKPFPGIWFTHVENEPVQLLAELGIPVGAAVLVVVAAAWLALAWRGRRSWAEAGAAAGAFALLLQNLADFSLQHASGLALAALLSFAPERRRRGDRSLADDAPRAAGRLRAGLAGVLGSRGWGAAVAAGGALLLGLGGAAAWPGLDADGERLLAIAKEATLPELKEAAARASRLRPGDYLPADLVATRLLAEGDAKEALVWINRLRFLQPFGPRGHLLAGEALAQLGHGRQALLEYRMAARLGLPTIAEVVARFPDSEAILFATPVEPGPARAAALKLAQLDRRGDGIAVATRALEKAPDDEGLLSALFRLRTGAKEYDEALALASRRRALHPDTEGAWADEAAAIARLNRVDEARALYEEGLQRLPGAPALVFGLARLDLQEKRPDEALATLRRLHLAIPAGTRATYHALRAQAFRQQRSLIKARDELRLATRLAPDREWQRIQLADVLLDLGRVDEAAAEVDRLGDSAAAGAARDRVARRAALEAESRKALERERLERAASGR
ncbi:MAG TPA: O-antigen ligase family protein [Vulgatibacter sp.]|nr:O-antigen ligase family protein [Vulgatibacter sp.]